MKRPNKPQRSTGYQFDPREIPELFASRELSRSANAIVLSDAVFEIEKIFRTGGMVRRASLPLYDSKDLRSSRNLLVDLLHDLIVFILAEDVAITFKSSQLEQPRGEEPQRRFRTTKNLCLFSGGVDSYAGILLAKKTLRDVAGVFCAHSDQARMIHIVSEIQRKILRKANIDIHKLRVPSVGSHGYAQLRGFLYVVGTAAW